MTDITSADVPVIDHADAFTDFGYLDPEGDAPRWAHVLNENLALVYNKQIAAESLVSKIHGVVDELKPAVMDVVDGLQKNPMFKMLLGGKSK